MLVYLSNSESNIISQPINVEITSSFGQLPPLLVYGISCTYHLKASIEFFRLNKNLTQMIDIFNLIFQKKTIELLNIAFKGGDIYISHCDARGNVVIFFVVERHHRRLSSKNCDEKLEIFY